MMEQLIASVGDTLTRKKVRQKQVVVFPVGKGIEVGADTGIIIPITEDFTHDHHKDSVKAAGIIILISMAINHPLQAPHSMPQ